MAEPSPFSKEDRKRDKARLNNRKNKYSKRGITEERYLEMLEEQGYGCAICRCHPGATRLFMDHDHKTGRIRGLLCVGCNSVLGYGKDSPRILAAAIVYLEDHGIRYPSLDDDED